jgi:hypothetical protein
MCYVQLWQDLSRCLEQKVLGFHCSSCYTPRFHHDSVPLDPHAVILNLPTESTEGFLAILTIVAERYVGRHRGDRVHHLPWCSYQG